MEVQWMCNVTLIETEKSLLGKDHTRSYSDTKGLQKYLTFKHESS